jgi:hypothetical protein
MELSFEQEYSKLHEDHKNRKERLINKKEHKVKESSCSSDANRLVLA